MIPSIKGLKKFLPKSFKRLILNISILLIIGLVANIFFNFFEIYYIPDAKTAIDKILEEPTTSNDFNLNEMFITLRDEFNPKISNPMATTFKEKDTVEVASEDMLGTYKDKCPNVGTDNSDAPKWKELSGKALSESCLVMNPAVKKRISDNHQALLSSIRSNDNPHFAYPGEKLYNGNGIVFVAGGKYSLMVYSIIKTIRKLKTSLPIEVLIPTDEDSITDEAFCDLIGNYNAKCIYLNRIFSTELLQKTQFQGFQYKSLALLASSFENVLLLDADDYPLRNIDFIFEEDIYKTNGLIIWPDFWRRTTHPFFYESAAAEIDTSGRVRNGLDTVTNLAHTLNSYEKSTKDVPYHDFQGALPDPSSETGQMMINKKKHWNTLTLSFYYNIFGPNLYYHLLSQYSSGQGDKETFIAAAHLCDLPYYQIFTSPSMDGYFTESGDYRGLAYYQKDFRVDYQAKLKLNKDSTKFSELKKGDIAYIKENYFNGDLSKEHALFAHCNLPKFNPLKMATDEEFVKDKKHFRGFTNTVCLGGLDLEQEINEAYNEILCKRSKVFAFLFDKAERKVICKYIDQRLKLFKDEPLFTS